MACPFIHSVIEDDRVAATMSSVSRRFTKVHVLRISELNKLGDLREDLAEVLAKNVEQNHKVYGIAVDAPLARDEYKERIFEAAFRNPRIKTLWVEHRAEISHISRWVSIMPNLDAIHFRGHASRNSGADPNVILQVIESCKTLKTIRLCYIRSADMLFQAMAPYLRSSSMLKELSINNCGIIYRAATIRAIEEALENNKLKTLNLGQTRSGPGLIGRLVDALSRNSSLIELVIFNCSLHDDDVVALCQGLENNTMLKSLELDASRMGDTGVSAVATLITRNNHLTKISISDHGGSDKTMMQIGDALKTNTSLKLLRMYRCSSRGGSVGQNCIRAILDGIKEHPSLTIVDPPDGFSEMQTHELWYYLEKNKGAGHVLSAPLNVWPRALNRADRCCPQSSNPPSVLYYFVREKCDLFNVSAYAAEESSEAVEDLETQGCKRERSECESACPHKRRKGLQRKVR
jgi:Ran GTPase-activating protein (RanGAP) involved in mRNA processing and transport